MSQLSSHRQSENLSGMAIRGIFCQGADEEDTVQTIPGDSVVIKGASTLTEYSNRLYTQPLIKACDVNEDIREEILDLILTAVESMLWKKKEIAQYLKAELDLKYGAMWHVIVGEQFGFDITFEATSLLYGFYGSLGILIWKCGSALSVEI